jgi:hypothetical protein
MEGAALTRSGIEYLVGLGAPIKSMPARPAGVFCKPCLDWSERRPHLAGAVGAAICTMCFENGWLRRSSGRAVTLTPKGRLALRRQLFVATEVEATGNRPKVDGLASAAS